MLLEVYAEFLQDIKTVGVVDYALASYIAVTHIQGYIVVPPVIPERAIKKLVEKDWGHGRFSDNLWEQTENVKEHLRTTLVSSMQRDESFRTTTVKLQKRRKNT
ncbi:hypothetical protein [Bacillus cereus]|uniref:hypothetical protein n=1 Tax=Bacillus cereus TaxID=1396 RepID=UPI000BF73E9C|nr:hypothetical protein [Bacillus cereus]PFR44380.1 hypothetical protein COK35_30515 [Bacillus cereus]